jgi:CMP/dCMP kinase
VTSNVVVAIDGPSGSGKSSTSRGVAAKLGLRYLDTGAMFRAMTWFMLREGVDVSDPRAVAGRVNSPLIESGTDPNHPTISVDGVDVASAIREQAVTNAVSPVSAVPEVRARLLELQRAQISEGGIVVEGRDIGSVVWPQAEVKVYLTADPAERARRRAAELGTDPEVVLREQAMRDERDRSRAVAPLVAAPDAVPVDTTGLGLDEVVDQIVTLAVEAKELTP